VPGFTTQCGLLTLHDAVLSKKTAPAANLLPLRDGFDVNTIPSAFSLSYETLRQ
jgi:hypothetical protein